jgi:hypothetical protein
VLIAELTRHRIEAAAAKDRRAPYICPGCGSSVILRRGPVRIAHFAHRPGVGCEYAVGETQAHMTAKRLFCDAFRARGLRSEVEYQIGNQRADVVVWSPAGRMAVVELQHTNLDVEELRNRIRNYRSKDVPQIWVPFVRPEVFDYRKKEQYDPDRRLDFERNFRSLALVRKILDYGPDFPRWETGSYEIPDRLSSPSVVEHYSIRPFERYLSKIYGDRLWFYDETILSIFMGSFEQTAVAREGGYDSDGEYHDDSYYFSNRWKQLNLGISTPLSNVRLAFTKMYLGLNIVSGDER